MLADEADDNDVMMLNEQIGNSFRMEARQMNSKNAVSCVRVSAHICSFSIYTLRLFVAQLFCDFGRVVEDFCCELWESPNYPFLFWKTNIFCRSF